MDKYITDNFTGSIDDLLNHCSNLDTTKVEEQVKAEEKEACIQVIMKELRFWYNTKWLEYMKKKDPYGTWGNKPYMIVKGLPDDYKHLTRKDLRSWWNTRKPGSYPQVDGYEDDDVIVTNILILTSLHTTD